MSTGHSISCILNRLDDVVADPASCGGSQAGVRSRCFLIRYFVAFLKGTDERTRTDGGGSQKESRHGRHHLAPRDAGPGSLRPIARRETNVRGPVGIAQRAGRRERAGLFEAARAVWEAFYGNAAAARQSASQGARTWKGPRTGLCGGVRTRPLRGSAAIAGPRRGSRARVPGGRRSCSSCICRRCGPCSQ